MPRPKLLVASVTLLAGSDATASRPGPRTSFPSSPAFSSVLRALPAIHPSIACLPCPCLSLQSSFQVLPNSFRLALSPPWQRSSARALPLPGPGAFLHPLTRRFQQNATCPNITVCAAVTHQVQYNCVCSSYTPTAPHTVTEAGRGKPPGWKDARQRKHASMAGRSGWWASAGCFRRCG